MSMTRERAIKAFEEIKENAQNNLGKKHAAGCEGYYQDKIDLADVALFALRPVSRERVEKVWRGEWNNINHVVLKPGVPWVCRCAKCGCPQDYRHNFCPNCGEAKTDGAVVMVMKRLEALHEAN